MKLSFSTPNRPESQAPGGGRESYGQDGVSETTLGPHGVESVDEISPYHLWDVMYAYIEDPEYELDVELYVEALSRQGRVPTSQPYELIPLLDLTEEERKKKPRKQPPALVVFSPRPEDEKQAYLMEYYLGIPSHAALEVYEGLKKRKYRVCIPTSMQFQEPSKPGKNKY